MFSRNSPLKRKHNEFHDPDYPQQVQQTEEEDDDKPSCSSFFRNKRRKSEDDVQTKNENQDEKYLHKVRQIIEREFQREIIMKQQQLKEIDDKLEKAKHLLDRLRYAIVLAYYKKQEIPLSAADAASLRGSNSLFEREDMGPQMPIHPSIKKLIGKKPKDLRDVLRTCPKRAAARNAVQTLRIKTQAQKREEKKIKQIIRDTGIVIDHSKQNSTENDVNTLLKTAIQNSCNSSSDPTTTTIKQEDPTKEALYKSSGKSLNAARLNNKIKHLIVVGNTSKYIGNEIESDVKSNTKNLTYKWLVYVQSKDTQKPIERFIKKVRFYLHQSYRPNDVVDIESPPFHITRRGWGEFPLRVQLFFHSELHQKPVQLIHNIILDKTLSGIQTLGAETLLEIWLRDVKSINSLKEETKDKNQKEKFDKEPENSTNLKTDIIPRSEELVDDNLLDFLNKIEASPCSISADIEKIQPTVVVEGPLAVKMKTPSPEKCKVVKSSQQKSPLKDTAPVETQNIPKKTLAETPNLTSNCIVSVAQSTTSVTVSEQFKKPLFSSGSLTSKPVPTIGRLASSSAQVELVNNTNIAANNISQIQALRPSTPSGTNSITPNQILPSPVQKSPIILNKDGKILKPSASVASAVHKTILPIVSSISTNVSKTNSEISQISMINKPKIVTAPKQILQKKLVQLVDSTGKIKYIQMLVAVTSASSSAQSMSTAAVAPKIITMAPSLLGNAVTNTTQITKPITTPLLKMANGVHLTPAKTTKPNIFKIVPESMQTKPQILSFSTPLVGTTNTNTPTTANIQQKLQHSITTTKQTVRPITTLSGRATSNVNNVTLPVENKLQKLNTNNTMTATKNLVFQKEGKLYIIDPQQMKYKQQQKKQVSLLKPQISLLKQQQQKPIAPSAAADSSTTTTDLPNSNDNVPHIYFGMKQQRLNSFNALQLMQMKRILFEKKFLRQEFTNVRSAVEFLLRRLKLITSKDFLVSDFPFASHTLQEFQSLTAFKQRACEWLRAKTISRLIRNHKDLQQLNNTSKEIYWSTKEIATFARQYAYTPSIKSLPRPGDKQFMGENSGFRDLVKTELKQEHNLQYDTLTDHKKVRKWVDKVWHNLEDYEHNEDQHQIIDIDAIEDEKSTKNKNTFAIYKTVSSHLTSSTSDIYLAPPPHLEHQSQLVSDMCKDLNVTLAHEELSTNVYHPSTQTALAQCLHLFIENILRQSIAFKQESSSISASDVNTLCTLMPQDVVKVLCSNNEFDFLTNINFGSAALTDSLDSYIKPEKP